jgi:hypothetical protein
MINTDLKIIWVIALLLLLIILLSGIKVCNLSKSNLNNRFIDRRYKYISEPFNNTISDDALKLLKVSDDYMSSNLQKMINEKIEDKKIKDLSKNTKILESKMKYLTT